MGRLGTLDRSRGLQNGAIAALVATVLHHTGRPHDQEVSALLEAVLGPYTAENHKMWRRNHRALIEQAESQRERLYGAAQIPSPEET